jgi:hypothetical protein
MREARLILAGHGTDTGYLTVVVKGTVDHLPRESVEMDRSLVWKDMVAAVEVVCGKQVGAKQDKTRQKYKRHAGRGEVR